MCTHGVSCRQGVYSISRYTFCIPSVLYTFCTSGKIAKIYTYSTRVHRDTRFALVSECAPYLAAARSSNPPMGDAAGKCNWHWVRRMHVRLRTHTKMHVHARIHTRRHAHERIHTRARAGTHTPPCKIRHTHTVGISQGSAPATNHGMHA